MTRTGIAFLDHTADLGMDLEAGSIEELLHRAAVGMLALLRGEEDDLSATEGAGTRAAARREGAGDSGAGSVHLELRADTTAALLADWLRELLFLHEVHHRDYSSFAAARVEPLRLEGVVRTRPGGHAVREIKGITYHALRVEEREGRWRARVIFDV